MTMFLLNATLKTSVIVVVALVTNAMLRRRSAAVRHFVLAAALACAAATPALRLVAPAWQATAAWLPTSRVLLIDRPLSVLDESASSTPSTGGRAAADAFSGVAVARSFGIIWIAGVAASLFVLAVGLARLAWLASRARRVTSGPWAEAAAADLAGVRAAPAARAAGERSSVAAGHVGHVALEGAAARGGSRVAGRSHPHRPRPRTGARAPR